MTFRNDNLIQKCFRKEWTLSEFLRQTEVRSHDVQQTCVNNEDSPCGYCGLPGVHIKCR